MAHLHHGEQLEDRGAAASRPGEPRDAAPAPAHRMSLAHRALACLMSLLLVATMNPAANDLSAFAAPSDGLRGGGVLSTTCPPRR